MPEAIGLCDANNFYASCERVFDARLRKKPVVVLSNNDGCVIARSNEAKQLGINMGAPMFKIENWLEQCEVEVFSSNYELYGDMSARLMENLTFFTPEVEIYSIDEAFLGLDAGKRSFESIGREIKESLLKWTHIPVSIGIAETKTLAKLANKLAKTSDKADGVLDLYKSPYQELALESTPVGDIWGIGRASVAKLKEQNVLTAKELRDIDLRWAKKALTVVGGRVITELRGIRAFPLELNPPPRYSITCSRSFAETITSPKDLRTAVAVYLSKAAERLRHHKLAANSVTVFISTSRFVSDVEYYSNTATHSSAYASDINQELQEWAFKCLGSIYKTGYSYRKAGIILGGLVPAEPLTTRMFDDERWERYRRVMSAVDEINRKFGRGTIRLCVANSAGAWSGRADRRSPRYTTRLNEVLTIK